MKFPSPTEPITIETIEWCLDQLALAMEREGEGAVVYMPIWHRLERERDILLNLDPRLAPVRERLAKRSLRQTAERT